MIHCQSEKIGLVVNIDIVATAVVASIRSEIKESGQAGLKVLGKDATHAEEPDEVTLDADL